MKKVTIAMFIMLLCGSNAYAGGCNEMAAFNTKVNKALKTASFSEKTLADLKNLQAECKLQYNLGMPLGTISSCNKVLSLVAVN